VGFILSRTIVRDLVSGVQAKKSIGHISLIQSVTPVLTPLMGAWVATLFGWRMVFVCTGALAALLLAMIARLLPESLPVSRRIPLHPVSMLKANRTVFGSGVFWRVSVTQALNWTAAFLYLAAAPKVITVLLGLDSTEMYKIFAAIALPMTMGFILLPRLLQRHSPRWVMVAAYWCYFVAILLNLAIGALKIDTLIVLAPLALCSLAVACTLPLLVGEALEPFPHSSGVASSCQMFLQYAFMVLTAGVIAPFAWHSLLGLAVAQACMLAVGFVLMLWQQRINRSLSARVSS
jgi:DHA1 family bicyclomycin/chloramphenicol resistance-like MFS transporter